MLKTIIVGDKPLELLANAATPYRMRQVFGVDVMKAFFNVKKDGGVDTANLLPQLAYVMNMQAQRADMSKLNEETFYEWCEQFGAFDLSSAGSDIMDVYLGNQISTSTAKKK